jgi:Raf kinase inhibitor-like YbhB/YbcL family protein
MHFRPHYNDLSIDVDIRKIELVSPKFNYGDFIPSTYTSDGKNISPPLNWSNVPEETNNLVITCEDPDAPIGTWVHWLLFNIPPEINRLPENFLLEKSSIPDIKGGLNDFYQLEYGGPCPPKGVHRYYFYIFALSSKIYLNEGIRKKDLEKTMEGLIIGKGELMCRYKRKK